MTNEMHGGHYADLGERFAGLLQRMGIESHFEDVYPSLVEHYSGAGRYYHNLEHVRRCLEIVDEVRSLLRDADGAELALWLHDIIYDPAANDNELRSALFFDRQLGVHLPTRRADGVHAMIMATVHPSEAKDRDTKFVADIDLAGMSLPWSDFLRDTDSLRMECRHLTDSQIRLGTVWFFESLLSRPGVYLTEYFQHKYGEMARRNISRFIALMEDDKGGPGQEQ